MDTKWKILLIVCLGALATCVFRPEYHQYFDQDGSMASVEQLNDYLRTTNDLYFYGAIPADTKVVFRDMPDAMGMTDCKEGHCTIYINPRKHPIWKEAEMTQLHEECHVYNVTQNQSEGLDGHSEHFQDCMERLAAAHAFRMIW